MMCSETAVVTPLETLNTHLNYKILDDFIVKITNPAAKIFSPTSLDNDNTKKNIKNNIPRSLPIVILHG